MQLRWVLWPVGSRSVQLGQDLLPDEISVVGRSRPLVLATLRASGLHCFGGRPPRSLASLEGSSRVSGLRQRGRGSL